jgi:hypothetical protein
MKDKHNHINSDKSRLTKSINQTEAGYFNIIGKTGASLPVKEITTGKEAPVLPVSAI